MGRGRDRVIMGLVLSAGLVAIALHAADLGSAWRALQHASLVPLLFALSFVALNYGALGLRFAVFAKLHGVEMTHERLARLGVLSIAINRAVGAAGLAGYALRASFARAHGQRATDILAGSLVNQGFKVALMGLIVPLLLFASLGGETTEGGSATAVTAAVLVSSISGFTVLAGGRLIDHPRIRDGRIGRLVSRWSQNRWGRLMAQARDSLVRGVRVLTDRPRAMLVPLACVLIEVATAMAVLWLAIAALGVHLGLASLVLAYATGFASRWVNLVPGGLGLHEATIAATLALLGVPFVVALVGALLYRVLMDWLPAAVAILLVRPLLGPGVSLRRRERATATS